MPTRADEPREAPSLDDARIRLEGQLEVVEKLTAHWQDAASALEGETWHSTGKDLWGPLAASSEAEREAVSAVKEEPAAHRLIAELRSAQNAAVEVARGRLSALGVTSTTAARGVLGELLAQLPLHFDRELIDFDSFRIPLGAGLTAGALVTVALQSTTHAHLGPGGAAFALVSFGVVVGAGINWLMKPSRRVVLREGMLTIGNRTMRLDEIHVVEAYVFSGGFMMHLDHLLRTDGETIRLRGAGRRAAELLDLLRVAGVRVAVETRTPPPSSGD